MHGRRMLRMCMMRSERKTEKWRIPGKWILIFLLILLAFYGYQNILAENYEFSVKIEISRNALYVQLPHGLSSNQLLSPHFLHWHKF